MRVGIVGGGITGLALTHYLAERDIDSVAFEATTEAGGVIRSEQVDGHVLETGPQRMRRSPAIAELARTAGVEGDIVEATEGDLYVYANGRLGEAPLSGRALLRTDLLSWRGKLRLLGEPLTRPGRPEETVADVFVRKFGRETYERFVGPLYGGLYGSDPAEMPAAFALEGLLEREEEAGSLLRAFKQRVGSGSQAPPITFEGGNQTLPRGLADVYADRIRLGTPVQRIERVDGSGDGESASGYVLETTDGREAVDAVVVTTPAGVAAALLAPVAPAAECLLDLRYNPLALVFLQSDHDHKGKGYQVGYGEDLHTLGVSWNGSMFGRDGLNTAFLGGMHDPEVLDCSDERLGEIARSELETVVNTPATVVDVARLDPGFPAWDQSWWALEDLELPDGLHLATNYTARMGVPSRVREAAEIAADLAGETGGEDRPDTDR